MHNLSSFEEVSDDYAYPLIQSGLNIPTSIIIMPVCTNEKNKLMSQARVSKAFCNLSDCFPL